jgi:hypothetical protein
MLTVVPISLIVTSFIACHNDAHTVAEAALYCGVILVVVFSSHARSLILIHKAASVLPSRTVVASRLAGAALVLASRATTTTTRIRLKTIA